VEDEDDDDIVVPDAPVLGSLANLLASARSADLVQPDHLGKEAPVGEAGKEIDNGTSASFNEDSTDDFDVPEAPVLASMIVHSDPLSTKEPEANEPVDNATGSSLRQKSSAASSDEDSTDDFDVPEAPVLESLLAQSAFLNTRAPGVDVNEQAHNGVRQVSADKDVSAVLDLISQEVDKSFVYNSDRDSADFEVPEAPVLESLVERRCRRRSSSAISVEIIDVPPAPELEPFGKSSRSVTARASGKDVSSYENIFRDYFSSRELREPCSTCFSRVQQY
jgi:hypothetical protein